MSERIEYYPLVDNRVVTAIAIVLSLFSIFLLLAFFNHMPRYGGMLPVEFWIPPLLVMAIVFTSAVIERAQDGYLVVWTFLSFKVRTRLYESIEAATVGERKRIFLSGLANGQSDFLHITFDKDVFDKLRAAGVRIQD